MNEGQAACGQDLLARLVWQGRNKASGNRVMHCNPRKDDLRRHLLQAKFWKSWGKHCQDEG